MLGVTEVLKRSLAVGVLWAAVGPAQGATYDPLEGLNRKIFAFNETLDAYVIKPVTQGYRYITPDPVEQGVTNVFSNLGDVTTLVNNLLQFKFHNAASDTSRIVANTVFGLGGVFDVATPLGLLQNDEDFGQTLGYWGVGTGPYLVLPFFGPSNIRDGLAKIPDSYTNPVTYLEDHEARVVLYALDVIDTRSRLLDKEKLITGDRYSFIRDAWWQRREFLVKDGAVMDSFGDDDF